VVVAVEASAGHHSHKLRRHLLRLEQHRLPQREALVVAVASGLRLRPLQEALQHLLLGVDLAGVAVLEEEVLLQLAVRHRNSTLALAAEVRPRLRDDVESSRRVDRDLLETQQGCCNKTHIANTTRAND